MLAFAAITATLLVASSCHGAPLVPKALSGPPSEFAQMALPNPTLGLINSDKAMFLLSMAGAQAGVCDMIQAFDCSLASRFLCAVSFVCFGSFLWC